MTDETDAMIEATVDSDTLTAAAGAVRAYGEALSGMYLQRTAEVRSLLIATIAGENLLLLGPPGTAKSALTLSFAAGLGWRSFTRLLGRTTVPEELFGPYSLAGLESDRFERVIDGYLPTAQVAFIDEIFKGSSAILNGLLTVLNEHAFDQGSIRIGIPLQVCVGASNELPQEDGLGALYDRFMVRHWVEYLQDEDAFSSMLLAGVGVQPIVDPTHLATLQAAAAAVEYDHLVPVIVEIRRALLQEKVQASDRRWRKSIGLIRASAVLDGRTVATRRDLAVLSDCLWDKPQDRDLIRGVVAKMRNPALASAERLLAAFRAEVAKLPKAETATAAQMAPIQKGMAELDKMVKEAGKIDSSDPEVAAVVAVIRRESKAYLAAVQASVAGLNI